MRSVDMTSQAAPTFTVKVLHYMIKDSDCTQSY